MAVIKQQRTTFASPIGVVRANTGAGAVFRGVNKIADQMIEESFRSAKEKALEAGEDLARSKELGSLRSINPATGLPEMSLMSTLAPPQEFGSIAQKAYKRVIESRYVSQIEQDFKLKAKELYIEHKDDPNGSQLFSDSLGNFIDDSLEQVDPRFKGVISSVGASLLASNKINFIEQKAITTKENILVDFDSHFESGLADLVNLWGAGDEKASEDARQNEQRLLQRIEDLRLSDPKGMNPKLYKEYKQEIFKARISGTVSRISSLVEGTKELEAVDVNNLRSVLSRNGVGLEDLPKPLQDLASEIITSEIIEFSDGDSPVTTKIFNQVKKFADTQLASVQARIVNRQNAELASESRLEKDQKERDLIFRDESLSGLTESRQTVDRDIAARLLDQDVDGAIAAFKSYSRETSALSDPSLGDAAISVTTTESSIKNLRQSLLTSLLDVATSSLTAKQSVDLTQYIDTVGKYGRVPDSLKPLADKIIDTMDIGVDAAKMARYGNAINVDKARVEAANAATNSTIKAGKEIGNGQGHSTNAKHAEVMDSAIIDTIGQGNEQFFLTSEAVNTRNTWGKSVINSNVLPDSLQSYMKNLYAGMPMPPEAQQNLMVLYDQFSRVLSTDGSKAATNMWANSKLTSSEVGFFNAVLGVARFQGYDNLPQIMDDVRQQHQDKAAQSIKMAAMFPDGLNDFLVKQTTDVPSFGSNTVNPNIAKDLLPYVEYLVAGNASRETIEGLTKSFFKDLYPETEGVVQDFEFGNVNRSRQALSAIFPNKDDRLQVVSFLNRLVAEKYGMPNKRFNLTKYDSEFVEGQGLVDLPPQDRLVLMPLQGSGTPTDSMRYMVVERRSNGMMVPFIAAARGGSPQEVNVPQQVIVDVAQLKSAVDVDLPEPIDPKKLAQLEEQRRTGKVKFEPTIGGGFAGQLYDAVRSF